MWRKMAGKSLLDALIVAQIGDRRLHDHNICRCGTLRQSLKCRCRGLGQETREATATATVAINRRQDRQDHIIAIAALIIQHLLHPFEPSAVTSNVDNLSSPAAPVSSSCPSHSIPPSAQLKSKYSAIRPLAPPSISSLYALRVTITTRTFIVISRGS
jgi:hypothetical protein